MIDIFENYTFTEDNRSILKQVMDDMYTSTVSIDEDTLELNPSLFPREFIKEVFSQCIAKGVDLEDLKKYCVLAFFKLHLVTVEQGFKERVEPLTCINCDLPIEGKFAYCSKCVSMV